ncbi:hypothetical protein LM500065_80600 [Listeria monocytogenes]|nr:hypothetical protein LM500065_80600 [Listeria monocytogenes]CUL58922.1 hypothetical protein LM800235_40216 [Listeria monocytogenes]
MNSESPIRIIPCSTQRNTLIILFNHMDTLIDPLYKLSFELKYLEEILFSIFDN